jgi:hypothetical protein
MIWVVWIICWQFIESLLLEAIVMLVIWKWFGMVLGSGWDKKTRNDRPIRAATCRPSRRVGTSHEPNRPSDFQSRLQ